MASLIPFENCQLVEKRAFALICVVPQRTTAFLWLMKIFTKFVHFWVLYFVSAQILTVSNVSPSVFINQRIRLLEASSLSGTAITVKKKVRWRWRNSILYIDYYMYMSLSNMSFIELTEWFVSFPTQIAIYDSWITPHCSYVSRCIFLILSRQWNAGHKQHFIFAILRSKIEWFTDLLGFIQINWADLLKRNWAILVKSTDTRTTNVEI